MINYSRFLLFRQRCLRSVTILLLLVRTLDRHVDVVCLLLLKNCKLSVESWQVESCHFLIKLLGEHVDFTCSVFVVVLVGPQLELSKNLVRE